MTGLFADNDDMALAGRQVIETAGLGDQVFVGGVTQCRPPGSGCQRAVSGDLP
jgi:hypothetical protein